MSSLAPVTVDEVCCLLEKMSGKSSPLDFVPTSLLKSCSEAFSQINAHLANLSFHEDVFPRKFKTAQITTLLNKPSLDEAEAANYRPISNLITISKVIERLYLTHLLPHVAKSPNYNPLQKDALNKDGIAEGCKRHV